MSEARLDPPPQRPLLSAVVLACPGQGALPAALLEGKFPRPGGALLFKTANSLEGRAASGY
ncbi:hypothetical protein DFAR_950015 [Desulfarculales bacterium]